MFSILLLLSALGISDAAYLTFEHYQKTVPPCINLPLADCGKVLSSSYATIFGVPLALLGVSYYAVLTIAIVLAFTQNKKAAKYTVLLVSTMGFLTTVFLVYLQFFDIRAICLYCMVSALLSTLIFLFSGVAFSKERKRITISIMGFFYRNISKKIFFLINPEIIHNRMTHFGEGIASTKPVQGLMKYMLYSKEPKLEQNFFDIHFQFPVGLSAGFDYEGKLTQSLSPLGFGFQTVGTITHKPYEGNPKPMLGRLPKSRSLMVNKGFKNLGSKETVKRLENLPFSIPVGISIGRTNSPELKTQKQSIEDIIATFTAFKNSNVHHAYYELNISCPNLYGDITFYPPQNLEELLSEVDRLKIKKPIFMKMPIEKSDADVLSMLDVIAKHSPKGVIFGNLQKNRNDSTLFPDEVARFKVGNFSGKPTYKRSNELIKLAYKHYNKRFLIIGCGGVFNGHDAYEKITLGASLIQLITGMIFEGPQMISQINFELADLLERDGFNHISEAVGSKT